MGNRRKGDRNLTIQSIQVMEEGVVSFLLPHLIRHAENFS
jgi:hypothetical protein